LANDARRTVRSGEARMREVGKAPPDIATPSGCKAHASIDRRHRLIRHWDVTDAFGAALGPMAGRRLTP
jgi:hypothetical protein